MGINYENIFNYIYANIDLIISKYGKILSESNLTQKYLEQINEDIDIVDKEKYAFALSFTTTLILYHQI